MQDMAKNRDEDYDESTDAWMKSHIRVQNRMAAEAERDGKREQAIIHEHSADRARRLNQK